MERSSSQELWVLQIIPRAFLWRDSLAHCAAFCLSVHRFIWRRWEARRKIIIMGKMQWRNLGTGTLSARSGLLCSGRRLVASGSSAWVCLLSVLRRCTMSGINCVWIHRCWMYHKHGDPCGSHLKTFLFNLFAQRTLGLQGVFFYPIRPQHFFLGSACATQRHGWWRRSHNPATGKGDIWVS